MKITDRKFLEFLEIFPEVDLPVTLGEETHHTFSKYNNPLNQDAINAFIMQYEDPADEMTEFVPCFRLKPSAEVVTILYWRAGLMDYRYILATYSKDGKRIASKVIAGAFFDGEHLTQSVATIEEDMTITILSGQSDDTAANFNPLTSTTKEMEIMPDGTIQVYED